MSQLQTSPSSPQQAVRPRAPQTESTINYIFRVYYGPILMKWYVKVLVIMAFLAFAAVSAVGITRMKYGQPISDLAPDGSYLQDYYEVQQATYAKQVGDMIGLYFRGIDFSDPVQQGKMMMTLDRVLSNSFINASTSAFNQNNWYIAFNQYAATQTTLTSAGSCFNPYYNRGGYGSWTPVVSVLAVTQPITGCVPQAQFYPLLTSFLALPANAGYRDSIHLSGGVIMTAQMPVIQVGPAGDSDGKFSMNFITSIRATDASANSDLYGAECSSYKSYVYFSWSSSYLFNEGDAELPHDVLEYFMLALAGVGFVTLLLLVNPWTALLLMCSVGIVDLYLFGELWILGIKFNQVSVINMVMATGLAIDYSVYLAQKFMTCVADGTRDGRALLALTDTGSAIFLGGLSALAGTVPMAFAKSIIIRTFFKLIFGTILFSLLVGLVLLPVVLALVGPPPILGTAAAIAMDHGGGHGGKGEEEEKEVEGGGAAGQGRRTMNNV